jgi:hypothetical protein
MRKEDINVIDSDIENKSEDMSDFEVWNIIISKFI